MFYRGIDTDPTSCGTSIAIADCPWLREGYPPRRGTLPGGCKVSLHNWTPLLISGEQSTPVQSNVKGGAYRYIFHVNYHVAQKVAAIGKYFIAVPFPPTHKVKL